MLPMLKLIFCNIKLNAGPIISPSCLTDINWASFMVRLSFELVLATMPKIDDPDPDPIPAMSRDTTTIHAVVDAMYIKLPEEGFQVVVLRLFVKNSLKNQALY